jgi:hypothetical protein
MEQVTFNKIYFIVNEIGFINLLFKDNKKQQYLYFDGINFHIEDEIYFLEKLIYFNYNNTEVNLYIEEITQEFDMYFIKISNGDIFQIYYVFDDEEAEQKLIIFDEDSKSISTPLGISSYEAALKRANEAEKIEIII